MTSVLLVFVVFLLLISLAVFFWFWWVGPRDQVPPHLAEPELRRLEVQDRIRQTNYQVLTALGLGATFLTTLFQFVVSSEHWTTEFESKANQDRTAQFVEAVRQLDQSSTPPATALIVPPSSGTAPAAAPLSDNKTGQSAPAPMPVASAPIEMAATSIAGMRTLQLLGIQRPEQYHQAAHDFISAYVISKTRGKEILRDSQECRNDFRLARGEFEKLLASETANSIPADREEGLPAVQAAMTSLGDRKFSKFRLHNEGRECESAPFAGYKLKLEHVVLDDLDLSGEDLSCSLLSQSKFRRTSLYGTNLSYADLRGARLADYDIKGSPAATGSIKNLLYTSEKDQGPPEWKRTRCWVTDLRGANLSHANLEGAFLDGADLSDADLTGANLCRADISRANFSRAKGLTSDMLQDACVGPSDIESGYDFLAQPIGLERFSLIRRCGQYDCPRSNPAAVIQVVEATPTARDIVGTAIAKLRAVPMADIASVASLAAAWVVFYLVGLFAKSRLETALPNSLVKFPSRFPERSLSYPADLLQIFVRAHPETARYYRMPILFPLDLIVMVLLSATMAGASWHWFAASEFPYPMLAVILPLLYFAADFAEDWRLGQLLVRPDAVTDDAVWSLKKLTALKLVMVNAAVIQTLAALSAYIWCSGIRLP
jgi:uncharacterized protein YjbI with pentapeptide repeats